MPSVEVIAVGTELLLGQLVDTNTAFIAQKLAQIGVNVYGTHAVGDNRARIAAAVKSSLDRADGVITTGGLGPTVDDLTKEAVCDALECETEIDRRALDDIEALFRRLRRDMRENNRKQAQVPRGAVVLYNARGTAPGFIATGSDGKFVASVPGVPDEMRPMVEDGIVPWLRDRFALNETIVTRVLHTIGIAESEIDHRIDDLFRSSENPKIAVLAHDARCDVKIMARAATERDARALIEPLERIIGSRLGDHVFGTDDETLARAVLALLAKHQRTIAVAESCTGGQLAAAFTAVPGASKSFMGGIIAYDNSVKEQHLGVAHSTLAAHGAVSEETAKAMAVGVRTAMRADIGISTTGIAGPDGGTPEKPVGLVWTGIADASGGRATKMQWRGSRATIQQRATTYALGAVWRALAVGEPLAERRS